MLQHLGHVSDREELFSLMLVSPALNQVEAFYSSDSRDKLQALQHIGTTLLCACGRDREKRSSEREIERRSTERLERSIAEERNQGDGSIL